jgi:hypothetical protein
MGEGLVLFQDISRPIAFVKTAKVTQELCNSGIIIFNSVQKTYFLKKMKKKKLERLSVILNSNANSRFC